MSDDTAYEVFQSADDGLWYWLAPASDVAVGPFATPQAAIEDAETDADAELFYVGGVNA